ncbi:MAG: hypothetical protein R2881_06795 [Eubacteriales bacterium]
MNIIGCLDVADSGEYILDGQSIEQYYRREESRIRNKKDRVHLPELQPASHA